VTRTRGVLGPEALSQYRWIDLPYGTAIRPNAAHGVNFRVRLTGNTTLEPPLNGKAGQRITLYVEQDGTGSRTVTTHAGWATSGTISIAASANAVTVLEAICTDAVAKTWRLWQASTSGSSPVNSWPVGSVFMGVVATNPSVLLGGGSWSSLGSGNVTIGGGTMSVYAWERTA
jgi:hypothetical protein